MKKLLSIAVLFLFLFTACDKCSDVECLNGGSCDKGECACPFEWEGDKCETKTLTKHMGEYSVNLKIGEVYDEDFEFELFPDATDPKKFYIGSITEGVTVLLTSRTEFNVAEQSVLFPDIDNPDDFVRYDASGSGNFTSTGFVLTLVVEDPSFTAVLTATKM